MSTLRRPHKSLYNESGDCGLNPSWKGTCIDGLVSASMKEGFQSVSSASTTATRTNSVLANVSLFFRNLTRTTFSEILRCSPNLTNLELYEVSFEQP